MLHTALLTLALVSPERIAPMAADLPQDGSDAVTIYEYDVVRPAPGPDGNPRPAYMRTQVLVRFSAGLAETDRQELLGEGLVIERDIVKRLDLVLVRIADGASVTEVIERLDGRAGILYATPDHLVTDRDTFPNDSNFNQQYGKHNTGQSGGTSDADIDAPGAWDIGTGSAEFAVAIVDSGTEHGHPDLVGNRWQNSAEVNGTPGVDDDGNGYVDDLYGWDAYNNDGTTSGSTHGTHVAGIAAAQGNNGIGVAGVSWDSQIVSISGSSGNTSIVLTAYGYVLDLKDDYLASGGAEGANIVVTNSSFGIDFGDCSSSTYSPWNDMYDLMGQSGILSCAATANQQINVDVNGDVPTGCTSDFVVSVTATDDEDRRTFSGFGLTQIDLGAPGSSIRSTVTGGGYGTLTGTSMATPQVAGAVALLHSVASSGFGSLRDNDPATAALEIKRILLETVDVRPTLDGFTVSGGRMNVEAAAVEIASYGASAFNYCGPSQPNSTGQSGVMSMGGTNEVAANDMVMIASGLPTGAATLFLVSTDQGFVAQPGGSQGSLCLGGSIGRFVNQVGAASSAGEVTASVNLNAIPQPNGPVAGMVGQTWNFQAWYRDALFGFPISNFTDGLSVILQ